MMKQVQCFNLMIYKTLIIIVVTNISFHLCAILCEKNILELLFDIIFQTNKMYYKHNN